ncbi:MAG: DegT/DnrJ/EryC1/StrS family aminotransferase [Crocinitomicaceae bacterium]
MIKSIPLASPDIRPEDIKAVTEVLKSGMLVQGKNVQSLESNIANFTKTEYVSAVSNGTASLHLSLIALGIGEGDEVIIPALSYIATANVIEIVGATPVFVDVELDTFNIDTSKIEDKISSNTKAIMPVHEFGLTADMTSIMAIAVKHKLYVIEDAACALGATHKGQFSGTFGDFGSFSLHPRKAISSGEGGLLISKNKELQQKINILRNHGIDFSTGQMDFVEAGYNYRLTDFQAALVNSQLSRLTKTLNYKNELAEVYFDEINSDTIVLPTVPEESTHTWQTFHILLPEDFNRQELIQKLRDKGVGTNYGAQCIPAQTYYYNKYKIDSSVYHPNALRAFNSGLAIPLYEKLQKEDILYIAQELNKI